jgi:HAD superfamily phosphoserine phosphatase-like hydrolase
MTERKEVKEERRGVAAFFDLDGTLVSLPSLERKFFRTLRYRRAIPIKNYFLWLREAARLLPRGINTILQANKMHLRGVQSIDECGEGDGIVSPWHKDGHQAEGQASAPPRRNPRLPVPTFFAQGIERVAWHAKQGHEIVLISGTLEPLAREAARVLQGELAARGIPVKIRVLATRLEAIHGRWTGRVLGAAMFGKAKARAVKKLEKVMQLDLTQSYAYGDSAKDEAMLDAVGNPTAVNPSRRLTRVAREREWLVLRWNEKTELTQRTQSSQRSQRKERKNSAAPAQKTVLRQAERCG